MTHTFINAQRTTGTIMGSSTSKFSLLSEDLLEEYSTLTYLSRTEILSLFKTFSNFHHYMNENLEFRFAVSDIEDAFPQLKYNPFRDRIYRVFSSNKDNRFSFEDVLDLCSVMSEKCPDKVKAAWAFRIFDFDEDGYVGQQDLMTAIDRLTDRDHGNYIEEQEKYQIIQVLLQDMVVEANGNIGELEFQHAVGKMSEFPHSFCFRF